MNPIIRIEGLKKNFVSQTAGSQIISALDHVSFTVDEGEVLGILGPNGAGKTTLINILSTLLIPDQGRFEIAGISGDPRNFSRLRHIINLSSGNPNFPWSLTVLENLKFYGRLYGLSFKELKAKTDELIEMFDLGRVADMRFDELSSGNKQRLSLAKAFLNDPQVIFLDEPTSGLDPEAAANIRKQVMDLIDKRKLTVLLTSHNMQEVELLCHRIAFIKSGEIIRLSSLSELKALQGKDNLEEIFIELANIKTGLKSVGPLPDLAKAMEFTPARSGPHPRGSLKRAVVNWIRRTLAFTYRNMIFAVRNVFSFAEMLFWPGVTLLSIGLMGNYLELGASALTFILTGSIAGGVLQVVQLDVSYSLLYDVWSKSMKHTLIAPLELSENMFGSWLVGILRGGVVFLILIMAATLIFDFQSPGWDITAVFLLGIFTNAILLGGFVSFLVLLFGQKAEISAWMFAYLLMLLSGIYYPVRMLPPFFYALAQWVPMTYFLEYYREAIGFAPQFNHGLLKGFLLVGLYLVMEHFMLRFALMRARQKGVIVRVSE